MSQNKGKVTLVGAGPGDPDLITIKGRSAIAKADVIVYDYLANPALLAFAPDGCELIYVGKKGGDHTMKQQDINRLLVEKGLQGHRVVRLKGGDCYIFGRGSEEAEELVRAGIEIEVIPGIPAAIGASATAGIPLTDRRCTSTLSFVTGHEDPTKPESALHWDQLAKGIGTIVFYMGVKNLEAISAKLIENGRARDTMVSIVEWATTSNQRIVQGTLEDIAEKAIEAGIKPPSLIIVGEVGRFSETLNWFDRQQLAGRRIVVTRSRKQASRLVEILRELGADTVEMPTIDIAPPDDWKPLDDAIHHIEDYDWIVFTSVNGVDFFMKRMFELDFDARVLHTAKFVTIGPATTEKLEQYGLKTDFQPENFVAESIIEGMKELDTIKGWRFLMPRADIARKNLAEELLKEGAQVNEVAVYRTVPGGFDVESLKARIEAGEIDAITFTSSSTANYFVDRAGESFIMNNRDRFAAVSIGPITSKALRARGIEPAVEADEYTIPGLVDAIVKLLKKD